MGKPVRIAEVAQQIADLVPEPVEITYTGLRPGEKLHEQLFGPGEQDIRPLHPLISHVQVPPLDPAKVQLLDPYADPTELVADLARLCRTHASRPVSTATLATLAIANTVPRGDEPSKHRIHEQPARSA
jgi:FlaA1/EpsC-like NDP-sugar epimerase